MINIVILQQNKYNFKIKPLEKLLKITTEMWGKVFEGLCYSQSRSRVNSNSKNEMNIRISLCNIRRVNEMLDISLEIVPKKTH